MAKLTRLFSLLLVCCATAVVAAALWWGYRPWKTATPVAAPDTEVVSAGMDVGALPVRLSPQARKNLGLVSRPLAPSTFWRTLELPGIIEDWPGISDRGVVTPLTGVVTKIHAFPGHSVDPDSPLFSIRLVSDALHASQLELFKATKEIEIARRQLNRLADVAQAGALAQSRVIEIENQIERLEVMVEAYRQDLQSRGLASDRIEAASRGEFITEIVVRAPGQGALKPTDNSAATGAWPVSAQPLESGPSPPNQPNPAATAQPAERPERLPFSFEMQSLSVELGQQVEAGEVLCYLADHRALLIEGRGFKDEMPWVQEAAKHGWEIEVDFDNAPPGNWPPAPQSLRIHYVANSVDPSSQTFAFYLALQNQWQAYTQDGVARLLWRFRPGTRVRLRVPVEAFRDVLVIPTQALVWEGPEAFVFRQNGDLFERLAVHVLHEDRQHAVLASDGNVRPGFYIAQSGAASLNRVLKAQATSGAPAGVHVHADGSVHGAH